MQPIFHYQRHQRPWPSLFIHVSLIRYHTFRIDAVTYLSPFTVVVSVLVKQLNLILVPLAYWPGAVQLVFGHVR